MHHRQTPSQTDHRQLQQLTRRHFFSRCGVGVGAIALQSLLAEDTCQAIAERDATIDPMTTRHTHMPAQAKAVIFLFMAGGPSQLDLFTDKPLLRKHHGELPPASYLNGKRFAFLKGTETLMASRYSFQRHGQSGQQLSELLPYHRKLADEVCWLHGMTTDVFNHGPAKLFVNTGFQQPGRPSMGSWVTYGLGNRSSDLPGFVVLQSGPRGPRAGSSLWSAGFLPTKHQGVPFRKEGEPILNLTSPAGVTRQRELKFVEAISDLNRERLQVVGDPEIATRIAAYEMAYRMQTSAPELMDLSDEPQYVLDQYGVEANRSSFARNCLLARRLVERGVRFIQLYHTNWDHHGGPSENLEQHLPSVCRQVDRASAALVLDLKQRGLLEDTIVIWGGEFGRTPMGEVREHTGRDHHIDAYSMWLAGGGFKPGCIHGETDDLGLTVVREAVHVHDLQATLLHQLGLDHERLTYRFQGRDYRLTDIEGRVVNEILV